MRSTLIAVMATAALSLAAPGRALAQAPQAPAAPAAPAPPPPVWAGSFGAGLAVTNGNSDTSNFNLAAKAAYDPANPHRATLEALYIHGSSEGNTTVSRTAFNLRDEYALTTRTSLFGQIGYLRDTFKGIDYLTSPTFGVTYKVVNLERTKFNIEGGAGVVWEKNTDVDSTNTSGAIIIGENVAHKLTSTTTITHAANGLWKTSDFGDSLYTVSAGLAAALTARMQIKLEILELYKSQPPPGKESQDVSFLTSVVYSF
jgi:putative salt-induced outer membrane protein YdiY